MTAALQTHPELGLVESAGAHVETRARVGLAPRTAWTLSCLGIDAGMLALAAAAVVIGDRAGGYSPTGLGSLAAFSALTLLLLYTRGLYELRIGLRMIDDIAGIVAATTIAAMAVVSVRLLAGVPPDVAAESVRPWAFAAVYLAAGRVALYWSQVRARQHGEACRPTLIVGAGKVGSLAAKRLLEHPELGLKPVAFLDKEPLADTAQTLGIPVAGASWDLDRVVHDLGAEHVVVTFSTAPDAVLLRLVRRCEELGLGVSIVPRLFEKVPERLEIDHLGGIALVTAHPANPKSWQYALKYAFDRVLAAALLALLLPVLAATALAVRLRMGRPILFRQLRVGRDGRTFDCFKFRSMRQSSESPAPLDLPEDTAPGGIEGDDRRTRLGAFLRRTSIDELPQLLNVLRGEMSLVGPRPERPVYVSQFERSVYRYGDRHRVRSGITGWAQVNGLRGKTSIADRAEWDNFYIENFSLWLDLKILLLTVAALIRSRQVE